MREITIDLSKNNRERQKILAGNEGENSATKIFVILPDSLTSCLISGSSRTLSAIIQNKENGYISEGESITIGGSNEVEIICTEIIENKKERVGQSDPFFFYITPSITGTDVSVDINTVFNAKE